MNFERLARDADLNARYGDAIDTGCLERGRTFLLPR
jgi:hypothetical protein